MSYANYGPTLRSQTVSNLNGQIDIPVAVGDPPVQTVTPLIQAVGGVETPLVLGEGTWLVSARAAQNPANAPATYNYIQCLLVDAAAGGAVLASSQAVFGADVLDGHNIEIYYQCDTFLTIAPGATRSLYLKAFVTGNSAIVSFSGGFANIAATKISA